ncbi:hypothetical protein EJ04DRAFT_529860 [Polyplosphaeria fusca]|uniref:Uncharacterized protein n=1 Tax=Polyplosphaeria fusca TaxID=682080 RepID=A0A9P4QLH3_9PLEO|nr:hypothetical protein EJ04DRAFT_529860 [Polyplosphaeria fusca]
MNQITEEWGNATLTTKCAVHMHFAPPLFLIISPRFSDKMKSLTSHLFLLFATVALAQDGPVPQPKLVNTTYYGSACPEGGLEATLGPLNTTTNIAPLTFTLSNFLPGLGSFGSSLRMCDITTSIAVDLGWKVNVNARGTTARGNADVPQNATMFLRGTYQFAARAEIQSVGMLDVIGPLSGQFAKRLEPVDDTQGVVGPCMGGEMYIEYQARAVDDMSRKFPRGVAANNTAWTLTTDVEVSWC